MTRACPQCAAHWRSTARWCGICGAPLDPHRDRRSAERSPRRLRAALAGAAVLVGLVAVVTLTHPDRGDSPAPVGVPGAADGEVRIAGAPDPPADDASAATPPGPTPDPAAEPAGRAWEIAVPGAGGLRARVVGDSVVTLTLDGEVTGRGAADGRERWRTRIPQQPDQAADEVWAWFRTGQVDTPAQLPAPVAGTVVVRRGDTLAFLEPATGELLGQSLLPVAGQHLASSGPSVLTSDGERVAAVGIPGTVAWERPVPAGHQVALRAHGAYFAGQGDVARLVANTGEEAWRAEVGASARVLDATTPTGAVLVAVDGAVPSLVALDRRDGSERWRAEVDGTVQRIAVGRDRLVADVATTDGHVILVLAPDPKDRYVVRRRLVLDASDVPSELLLIGRQIVVATGGSEAGVRLATPDGFLRQRLPTQGRPEVTSPDGRTLLIADDDGVTALALATGRERFTLPLARARPAAGSDTVFGGPEGLLAVDLASPPPRRGPCPRPGPGCAP